MVDNINEWIHFGVSWLTKLTVL